MRVLLTRPVAESEALAALLEGAGHTVVVAPVMDIVPTGETLSGDGIGALAVTSRNAVPALMARALPRDLPVYAVGAASADAVADAGFTDVHAAAGDVLALESLISSDREPADGRIIHLSGRHRAGDLVGALTAAGFDAELCIVYEAVAANKLPDAAREALVAGDVDAVLFYSSRSVATFLALVRAEADHGALISLLKNVVAIAISENAADQLDSDVWRSVIIAPEKTAAGMIVALETVEQREG